MAQGFGEIPVDALKAMTVYKDYEGEGDVYVERFWKAAGRFSLEQKKVVVEICHNFDKIAKSKFESKLQNSN